MSQPSFPLFRSPDPEPPEGLEFSVSDVIRNEVQRAALEGPDPAAVERIRLTIDLTAPTVDALQALAVALGSSRRAMATKLLEVAVWEAVNDLARNCSDDRDVEYLAVYSEFTHAHAALREKRQQKDQPE